jgi:hypothetical protein
MHHSISENDHNAKSRKSTKCEVSIIPRSFLRSRIDAVLERVKRKIAEVIYAEVFLSAACDCPHLKASRSHLCAMHGTLVERFQQLRPLRQGLSCLSVVEPMPIPLVLLGPLGFLLLDDRFIELVRGLGSLRGELVGSPLLRDEAEVVGDLAYYAGLFPGFAFGGVLGGGFVRLPSAFRKDPAVAFCGLDQEHVVLVGGKRDDTGD